MCATERKKQSYLKTMERFKQQNPHVCHYCGKIITEQEDLTVDHRVPLCKDGKTIASNLVIACEHCNVEKGCFTETEYKQWLTLPKDKQIAAKTALSLVSTILWQKDVTVPYISMSTQIKLVPVDSIHVPRYFPIPKRETVVRQLTQYRINNNQIQKPIKISCDNMLVDGFTRLIVARHYGLKSVPAVYVS